MTKIMNKVLSAVKYSLLEKGLISYYTNLHSYRKNIQKIKNEKKPKGKIRIGFMYQEPSIWSAEKSVYEAALKDPDVEVVVLAVPQLTFFMYVKLTAINYKDVYEPARALFSDFVETYNPNTGEWIDIHALNLDYMFFPRPYETYLPKQYRAIALSKYLKVCYIPYAYAMKDVYDTVYNTHFIRNAYMTFCENDVAYNYLTKKIHSNVEKGFQKVYNIGYPRFDLLEERERTGKGIWKREKSPDIKRIIWTPRWTPNLELGGSNFLKYKDPILRYALEHKDSCDLVFRPHPLTFRAFQEAGLITAEEIEKYLKLYEESENAVYDKSGDYLDTFYQSDVLITDISSIITEYMFTGNPIVYCPIQPELCKAELAMKDCYYVVQSPEEMEEALNRLSRGEDDRREYREAFARKMKPEYPIGKRILDTIKDNYKE